MVSHKLFYRILGVNVAVSCAAVELRRLVQAHWGDLASDEVPVDLWYQVSQDAATSDISISCPSQHTRVACDDGQFLYELEGDACIEIQQYRNDLFFVHAAVAEIEGRGYLFVAESGNGKSTTLWGLLHHGGRYLSDELAPIDLSSMEVYAYRRALCLKCLPPESYPLPAATVKTSSTLHVPVRHLPQVSSLDVCPIAAIYFVRFRRGASAPALNAVGAGEAAARLYCNTLNQLSHANAGLGAAARIARSIPSFTLETADLATTCDIINASLP